MSLRTGAPTFGMPEPVISNMVIGQLARRLDTLFAGADGVGLQDLFSGPGKSADWQDLSHLVGRVLGLPSGNGRSFARGAPPLDRLEYFSRGRHRN